jgi:hypothetical protein
LTRVLQNRQGPNQNFDMIYPDSIGDIRADGIGDVVLTAGGVKMALFQIRPAYAGADQMPADPAERVEVRQVVGVVSIGLAQAVEGLMNVLGAIAMNSDALGKARDEEHARMLSMLSKLEVELADVNPPGTSLRAADK